MEYRECGDCVRDTEKCFIFTETRKMVSQDIFTWTTKRPFSTDSIATICNMFEDKKGDN